MMTANKLIIMDADYLSAFLWTKSVEELIAFHKKILVLTDVVYNELCCVPHFRSIIDGYISKKEIELLEIMTEGLHYSRYIELKRISKSRKNIGKW